MLTINAISSLFILLSLVEMMPAIRQQHRPKAERLSCMVLLRMPRAGYDYFADLEPEPDPVLEPVLVLLPAPSAEPSAEPAEAAVMDVGGSM